MARLMDLANDARQKDCHLQAVLSVSEESLAGLKWQLVLPENARAKDKRAAKWVKDTLRANDNFSRFVAHHAGAFYYSYAVSEIDWKKESGKLVPKTFHSIAPRRFGFRPSDSRLVWRDAWMANDGVDFREEFPYRFIVSQPRVTGDVPQREGLLRCLVWAALFRNWTFSDWLRTGEIAWKPWRIGSYADNATNEDIDALEEALVGLSTNGVATHPQRTTIEVEWPGGTQTAKATHSELVNSIAQEMSKAVLGQTETVQSSSSSGYGQAKVHNQVRLDLRESRAKQIAGDITRDLVAVMIDLNFGSDVIVPKFEFLTEDAVDQKAFAEAMSVIVRAGLRVPAQWARDQLGIPEPDDDDEIIGPAAKAGDSADQSDEDDDEGDETDEPKSEAA